MPRSESLQQLKHSAPELASSITLDYLELYGLRPSVEKIKEAGIHARVASPRILKPSEQKIIRFLLSLNCDILVRSGGLLYDLIQTTESDNAPTTRPQVDWRFQPQRRELGNCLDFTRLRRNACYTGIRFEFRTNSRVNRKSSTYETRSHRLLSFASFPHGTLCILSIPFRWH